MALGRGLNSLLPQKHTTPSDNVAVVEGVSINQHSATHIEKPTVASDRVWYIPLTEISPNPEQPRKNFSHAELEDLIASIKEHGVLQPITVTERPDGGYELIAGERRFRASQMAGTVTIPALVRHATEQQKLELALIENIQRQDLNPIEEAFSYRRLTEVFGLKQHEVAARVGKSRPAIANAIRLLDLPEVIQKALIDGTFAMTKARAILSLKSVDDQLAMFADMMGQKISTVRDVERLVAAKGQISRKGSVRRDPNIMAQEQLLEERYGTRATITSRGEKGTVQFEYYSREELKRLLDELIG